MKLIQNTNMAFRCPIEFKERLESFAEKRNLHVSSVIRSACLDWVKRKDLEAFHEEEEARWVNLFTELMISDRGRLMKEDMK